jgi:thiol-disulfide isomerase/thioredoxin
MDPRRRLRPLILLVVLALTGCGSSGTDAGVEEGSAPTATTSMPASSPEQPDAEQPGPQDRTAKASEGVPETLAFEATTVGGEPFAGASAAGRPVLLWFWAPWCPTCRGQVPQVQEIAATYGDDLTVIGVGSLDSAEAIADFAADVDEVTHLEDVDGDLYRRFGITEQSSFVLLDDAGKVVLQSGYGGSDELDAEVAAVVG